MTIYMTKTITLGAAVLSLSSCATTQDNGPEVWHCPVEQVTFEAYDTFQFQGVSQDGRFLSVAWSKKQDTARGAYLLDLETGEKHQLPKQFNNTGSFSHDGQWLVGAHYISEENTDIFVYSLNGRVKKTISPHGSYDFLPSFSPDSNTILFNAFRSGNSEIVLVDRHSGNIRQITHNDVYDAHAEFSPDGDKILFHRMVRKRPSGGYDFDLYSLDLKHKHETRLTESPYEESYGSWGPDSQTIVFSSDFQQAPEKHNLYLRSPQGTLYRLTTGDWKDSYAYWSRDGRYVYFNSDRHGATNIFRIPMEGLTCGNA